MSSVKDELDVPPGARMIGVAGTVTQLAALKVGLLVYDPDVTHHMVLSHGDVRLTAKRLASLKYAQRRETPGLEPGRADVIVAGAEILLAVMETFDAAESPRVRKGHPGRSDPATPIGGRRNRLKPLDALCPGAFTDHWHGTDEGGYV